MHTFIRFYLYRMHCILCIVFNTSSTFYASCSMLLSLCILFYASICVSIFFYIKVFTYFLMHLIPRICPMHLVIFILLLPVSSYSILLTASQTMNLFHCVYFLTPNTLHSILGIAYYSTLLFICISSYASY